MAAGSNRARHQSSDAISYSVVFFLLTAMAAGTFTAAVYSVLGPFIVSEFTISRAQLGLIVALNTVSGGLMSPLVGRTVDRLGGGFSIQLVFMVAGVSFGLMAIAPFYGLLLLGAVVGGVAQALANPATNKVIAYRAPPAQRGTVTGVKQSGVQFGLFFGGLVLPSLAEWLGWRWAIAVVVGLCALGALGVYRSRHGTSLGAGESGPRHELRLHGSVRWLSIYGLLMGFSGSAIFFLPLFAEEELGQGIRAGGLAVALAGFTAIIGRVLWAWFAQRGSRYRLSLALIALLSVIASGLMTIADESIGFMWLGAALIGASVSSWNSVGMLAVINDSDADGAGSASGWVLFGFLIGLGVAPPIYGHTFDTSGSYLTMWLLSAAVAGVALLVMVLWKAADMRSGRTD